MKNKILPRKLKILYTNADTLTNKIRELQLLAEEHQTDIILVTEAKPKYSLDEISPQHVKLQGYDIVTNFDQKCSRGIAIYVKETLMENCTETIIASNFHESLWLTMKLRGKDKLLIGCVYRSPSSSLENDSSMRELLCRATRLNTSHIMITGDFNYPEINWNTMTTSKHEDHASQKFLDTMRDNFLLQHVTEPTRYRHGQNSNTLDLILTNEENMINRIQYLPGLGLSDHACLAYSLSVYTTEPKQEDPKYQYYKGDYPAINTQLQEVDWNTNLLGRSVEEAWSFTSMELNKAMSTHIPKSQPRKDKRRHIWMNHNAMAKQKRKHHAWKRYIDSGDYLDYIRATQEKNELTLLTRNLCRDFEKDIARNIKENPKAFWRYTNSKLKNRPKLGDLQTADGKLTSDNQEKAEILNRFFSSVFTKEDLTQIPTLHPIRSEINLASTLINPELVAKKLNKLNPSKSAGPDGIHPRVLKETANSICLPLSIIYSKSLAEGHLPPEWKEAVVTPIHKKGSKITAGNYRPVSLTTIVGRMMESLVRDSLVKHMMEGNLFCDAQHGFVPGRSCMTQLLISIEIWTELLDSGAPLDVIYLDFKKAFDSVPHQRLLSKLKSYGVIGPLWIWIQDFLLGRRQRVKVNGSVSSWADVTSGIPQGSVLGPILFVIYINDLPDAVMSTTKIFADDTKLFRSLLNPDDHQKLQEDLNQLVKWSQKWQLGFNESKCKVLHLGNSNKQKNYTMSNIILEETKEEKDLGVIVDKELKFNKHLANAVNKASRMLGLVRTTFTCLDETTIPKLFNALVRPHLEYGNVIWHPRFRKDKIEVEKVQRRATKLVPGLRHVPYEDRLKTLKMPSLDFRRRRGDMIHVYKILKGIDRLDPLEFFSLPSHTSTRGHSQKLYKKHCRLDHRRNVFSQRIIHDWNALPEQVISCATLNSFKTNLDKIWKNERYRLP